MSKPSPTPQNPDCTCCPTKTWRGEKCDSCTLIIALRYKDAARRAVITRRSRGGYRIVPPNPVKLFWQRRAMNEVQKAIARGSLPKLDGSIVCSECERVPAAVYDHRDYSKPLSVTAVCRHCNHELGSAIYPKHMGQRGVRSRTKPSWLDAPSWATHLAKNADTSWFWYEYMPDISRSTWVAEGRVQFAGHDGDDWKESVEPRP